MVLLYNMEMAGVFTKRDGGKNYSAIRNKLQLVRDVDGQNESEMQWEEAMEGERIGTLRVVMPPFRPD